MIWDAVDTRGPVPEKTQSRILKEFRDILEKWKMSFNFFFLQERYQQKQKRWFKNKDEVENTDSEFTDQT